MQTRQIQLELLKLDNRCMLGRLPPTDIHSIAEAYYGAYRTFLKKNSGQISVKLNYQIILTGRTGFNAHYVQ